MERFTTYDSKTILTHRLETAPTNKNADAKYRFPVFYYNGYLIQTKHNKS
jgi:hypothetical protein